jgi:hypothetical protein
VDEAAEFVETIPEVELDAAADADADAAADALVDTTIPGKLLDRRMNF